MSGLSWKTAQVLGIANTWKLDTADYLGKNRLMLDKPVGVGNERSTGVFASQNSLLKVSQES